VVALAVFAVTEIGLLRKVATPSNQLDHGDRLGGSITPQASDLLDIGYDLTKSANYYRTSAFAFQKSLIAENG
jgi:hypothetical protein